MYIYMYYGHYIYYITYSFYMYILSTITYKYVNMISLGINIRGRILMCLWVIHFHLYLENTIEFLVEQFIKMRILILLMSFSLN